MPTPLTIDAAQNLLAGAKVAVVGDGMVDRFIWGEVERISPEAPIPIVRVTKRTTHLGGAANVAMNLAALGAEPLLVSRIGRDEAANAFLELSAKYKLPTDALVRSTVPTISKTRIIARTQQVVRLDEETTDIMTADLRRDLTLRLNQVRKQADVVVVSDYGKGLIDAETLEQIRDLWRDGEVLVDPKPRKSVSYKGVTAMTPNKAETKLLLAAHIAEDSLPLGTDDEAAAAITKLMEVYDLQYALVTRSEHGMTIAERGQAPLHLPTHAIEVADVSGAGDTVIAALAAARANELPLAHAAQIANLAAGVVVGKLGTATATWAEVAAFAKSE